MWPFFMSRWNTGTQGTIGTHYPSNPEVRPQHFVSPEPSFSDIWSRNQGDDHLSALEDIPTSHSSPDHLAILATPPKSGSDHADEHGSYGFMMPREYGGMSVDEHAARRARGAGIAALGLGILSGAASGHYADGLTRGLEGFGSAMGGSLDRNRDFQRQKAEDDVRHQQADDAHQAAIQGREINQGQYAHQQGEWADEDAKREHNATAAAAMVGAIEKSAGPDSPEAQRARALAALGEDADLTRLATLHEDIVVRQRAPEDFRVKSQAEMEAKRARIAAGLEEDPLAAGRRADRGLDYEGQRIGIERTREAAYAAQVRKQANRDPTVEQFETDVATETNRLVSTSPLIERSKNVGKPDKSIMLDPARMKAWNVAHPGVIPTIQPPTLDEQQRERAAAEAIARQNVLNRYRHYQQGPQGIVPGGQGGMAPGHYVYDPQTGTFQ